MKSTSLDKRIYNDIQELKQVINGNSQAEITAAKNLNSVFKVGVNISECFSTKGLPSYYFGDRESTTVFVNLNPGMNARDCDGNLNVDIHNFNHSSTEAFIQDYHKRQVNYGKNFGLKKNGEADEFDVKQAAFLTSWTDSGIGLPIAPDWSDKDFCREAKTKVICNKLQLELIPYASAKFNINKISDISALYPYVDTLIEEIFSKERTYIIFAADVFDKIFKHYNKHNAMPKVYFEFIGNEEKYRLKKRCARCRVVKIHYDGRVTLALIAHTLPSQSLCRAFDLMQSYGKFCYEQFMIAMSATTNN